MVYWILSEKNKYFDHNNETDGPNMEYHILLSLFSQS